MPLENGSTPAPAPAPSPREAELAVKVKELEQTLERQRNLYATLQNDVEIRITEQAARRAEELREQDRAVQEDRANRAKPQVLRRPSTFAEWNAHSPGEKARMIDLYPGVIDEVLIEKRQADERTRREEIQRKLAAQTPILQR